MPTEYVDVLNSYKIRQHDVQHRAEDIFVHRCDLPKVTPEQLVAATEKSDEHVQFFMQHVPDYFDGMGLRLADLHLILPNEVPQLSC